MLLLEQSPFDAVRRLFDLRIRIPCKRESSAAGAFDLDRFDLFQASQPQRLHQLSLQYQGAQALHESDVIQALNLTHEQRLAMRAIESEYHLRGGPRRGGPPGPPREKGKEPGPHKPKTDDRKAGPGGPPPKKMSFPHREPHHWENDPEQLKHLLNVLTPEQRKQWEQLIGSPFQGDFEEQHDFFPRGETGENQPGV